MKKKQTARTVVLGLALAVGLFATPLALSAPVAADCGGVQTSIINCDQDGGSGDVEDSGLWGILILTINILMAGVGVLALAGIVYGAVLYTSAGGSTEQVKKAYGIFANVAIGVLAFAAMFTLLNFLIPGGVFNQ